MSTPTSPKRRNENLIMVHPRVLLVVRLMKLKEDPLANAISTPFREKMTIQCGHHKADKQTYTLQVFSSSAWCSLFIRLTSSGCSKTLHVRNGKWPRHPSTYTYSVHAGTKIDFRGIRRNLAGQWKIRWVLPARLELGKKVNEKDF